MRRRKDDSGVSAGTISDRCRQDASIDSPFPAAMKELVFRSPGSNWAAPALSMRSKLSAIQSRSHGHGAKILGGHSPVWERFR